MQIFSIALVNEVKQSEVAQSCPTLCDPMDCSLQGSSIHGIFQARVLEWVAISKLNKYLGLNFHELLTFPWSELIKITGGKNINEHHAC